MKIHASTIKNIMLRKATSLVLATLILLALYSISSIAYTQNWFSVITESTYRDIKLHFAWLCIYTAVLLPALMITAKAISYITDLNKGKTDEKNWFILC